MSLDTLARQAVAKRTTPKFGNARTDNATVPTQEDALSSIAKYVPTEIITLFLFGLSMLTAFEGNLAWISVANLFWLLLLFTPICFLLIFTAKWRAQKGDPKARPALSDIPVFRLSAATVGFAVWAPAVPKSGLVDESFTVLLAGAALFISTVFSLLEQVFEPKVAVAA